MKKLNKKGFTMVELVIVIAVIATLAAIMIPTFGGMLSSSKDTAAIANAQSTYKQYLANIDVSELESAGNDFIYVEGERYVVIKDGQVIDTVYGSNDAALAAQFADTAEIDYTVESEALIKGLYEVTATKKANNG